MKACSLAAVLALFLPAPSRAEPSQAGDATGLARVNYRDLKDLRAAFERFAGEIGEDPMKAATGDLEVASDVATCLWNVSPDAEDQKRLTGYGFKWAREIYDRDPDGVFGLYFMALNQLQFATSRGVLDTLFVLSKVRDLAEKAYGKEKGFFYSSPPILLGALYGNVPGFPLSFGDSKLSEKYLKEAVASEPLQTTALALYAHFLFKEDRSGEACGLLRKLREIRPWENPKGLFEKDMDFWWHVDQIRAIRALKAQEAGMSAGDLGDLLDKAPRQITESDLPKAVERALRE